MSNRTLRAALLAAFLAAPCAASAAVDTFLKIDGIEGESQDSQHKGELNIESFSWGASQTSASASGRGSTRGCAKEFNFTKLADKATPLLMANAMSGMPLSKAVLTVRKAGEKPLEFLKVTLETVVVSSYSVGGSGSSLPVDQFSLNFAKMTVEYKVQKPDGSPGETSTASFQGGC